MTPDSTLPVVAGIDVGGERKGCHLIVLQGTTVLSCIRSTDPAVLVRECLAQCVVAVGVDAPCQWAQPDLPRLAERQLAQARLSVFTTPTRTKALANASGFYGWMFNGERVFAALAAHYALWSGRNTGEPVCFETFPHAITAALLRGETASAKLKRPQRTQLLKDAGIDTAALATMDDLDAALCALSAQYLWRGQVTAYGDAAGGLIAVPQAIPA